MIVKSSAPVAMIVKFFARQLACAVAQGELVLTQAEQRKIKGHRCGDF
jgi:hypothetical protein